MGQSEARTETKQFWRERSFEFRFFEVVELCQLLVG